MPETSVQCFVVFRMLLSVHDLLCRVHFVLKTPPIIFITVISARNKIKMCNGIHCWMNIVM